jgi:hypothetical protein
VLATCAGCVNLIALDTIDTSVRSVINVISVLFGRSQDVEGSIISLVSVFLASDN